MILISLTFSTEDFNLKIVKSSKKSTGIFFIFLLKQRNKYSQYSWSFIHHAIYFVLVSVIFIAKILMERPYHNIGLFVSILCERPGFCSGVQPNCHRRLTV